VSIHIKNREEVILKALQEELVGPSSKGKELDTSTTLNFDTLADAAGPWIEKGTGEEILTRGRPNKRYGVAVLHPYGTFAADLNEDPGDVAQALAPEGTESGAEESTLPLSGDMPGYEAAEAIKDIADRTGRADQIADSEDPELTATNTYRPSSMGITLLVRLTSNASVVVNASGGRYVDTKVMVAGRERTWWIRRPWSFSAKWDGTELCRGSTVTVSKNSEAQGLIMSVEVYSRPFGSMNTRMITVSLINRTPATAGALDAHSLFQAGFSITLEGGDANAGILPYPDAANRALDEEEESINLLYRHALTYAIGHGCAADWSEGTKTIYGTCFPTFDAPTITPDIKRKDGTRLEIPMAVLAGLDDTSDGFESLEELVVLYSDWIKARREEAARLSLDYSAAAARHIAECESCVKRMRDGLEYLKTDPVALEAFRLANHAILLQQIRSRRQPRRRKYDERNKCWMFPEEPYPAVNYEATANKGAWRAFQIAFLLMSLRSTGEEKTTDRETVELIWFPTGGGKTEAYLGLAAFAMFLRRLRNSNDAGVSVLMRYTLRLLTAQQFQRASTLIVAMEYLRSKGPRLSATPPFSIGIWLGSATTPNRRDEALGVLRDLQKATKNTPNKFIISRCPWCGAEMGPVKNGGRLPIRVPRCAGYEREGPTVVFKCTDPACDFSNRLPIYVIDDDIYEHRPTLIIGTVDKFAMLAWEPKARSLFGFGPNGQRLNSPPGLIIQDELHLISGPLGSMVGLYEGAIEQLCTDERTDPPVRPKIVSSTATIRRYKDQVRSLYSRTQVALFPPPGLSAGDSFFGCYQRSVDGGVISGRKYVGVHAPGLGSVQTVQVRTFCALLQAPMSLNDKAEQDPWWTLLTFFNSLRELGTTLSLFQSDIPDYQNALRVRFGLKPNEIRRLRNIMELTGRLRGDEVQDAIDSLEIPADSRDARPIDACLASNIIEVGIDIERLSLICVVGQPKTTSQYIQVTGRIGRGSNRPGLVVAIYGASKPRDRSHFERFRSYHERLYAHVEPTSVTPFSPPALDRALHAVMSAYARQAGTAATAESPERYPEDLMTHLRESLTKRVQVVNRDEEPNFQQVFGRREREWKRWRRINWRASPDSENTPLLRTAGAYVSPADEKVSWATPTSLRNVDAECEIEITYSYLNDDAGDN
jgi:Helicase conserved C-terminal domain